MYSEDRTPFKEVDSGQTTVWSETQKYSLTFFTKDHKRTFTVEIPNMPANSSAEFVDKELRDSIECYVEQKPYPKGRPGYYRVEEGYVEVRMRTGGDVEVDYKVTFGTGDEEYRMEGSSGYY